MNYQGQAAARAIHLDTERGALTIGTSGATFGHNAAAATVTVAAVNVDWAYGAGLFTAGDAPAESYSSDGPRKIFYDPYGNPITPNNFLFSTNGGTTLPKVDITAADCVETQSTIYGQFCGTSAASPHAAAIAALMMSANPYLTPAEIKSNLLASGLPLIPMDTPRTVGSGIAMANIVIDLSPGNVNFSNQQLGATSPPQTVTLTNTGSGTLSINSITVTGADPGDFVVSNPCHIVSVGANCAVTVTFAPTQTGTRTAALSIGDNAAGTPQNVSLTGTGVTPAVTLSPGSLTFAPQLIGTTSAAQEVTLTNARGTTLTIVRIGITGTDASDFTIQTNTCGTSVAPRASCTISVAFMPKGRNARTASVSIGDKVSGSPQTVPLTGTGTIVELVPASLHLGGVALGSGSSPQTITLTNTGSAALGIAGIVPTGADIGDFLDTTTCGASLGAGKSCTITVTFKPQAKGTRTAQISVRDNGGASPQKVPLTGTGK